MPMLCSHAFADVLRAHWVVVSFGIAWGSGVFIAIAALFGGVRSWWALLGVPIAVPTAMAFVAPSSGSRPARDNEEGFTTIFRPVITPLHALSQAPFPGLAVADLVLRPAW